VLTRTGRFSGALRIGGRTFVLRGAFGIDGTSTLFVRLGDEPLQLHLRLATASSFGEIIASIEGPGFTGDFTLVRAAFSSGRRAPQAGVYSAFLEPDVTLPEQGVGYALMTVSVTGATLVRGKLPDGTAWSFAAKMREDGRLPLFVPIYRAAARGVLAGEIVFSPATAPAFDTMGSLVWIKSGPGGFTGSVAFDGGTYVRPLAPAPLLATSAPAPNAVLTFVGGGLGTPLVNDVHLSRALAVAVHPPNTAAIRCVTNRMTGFFRGSFHRPGDLKTVTFSGATVSKVNAGAGVFSRLNVRGAVQLTPK
jgi:hypothetical protein